MNDKKQTLSLKVEQWSGEVNAILSSITTTAASWLAPLPEAAMTTRSIVSIFGLPDVWAALVAGSIELVGVSVNAHYLSVVEFNANLEAYKEKHKAKTHRVPLEDEEAARKAVNRYYIITGLIVGLTAIYEVVFQSAPVITLLAIAFPFASAIGTKTMNRRASLHRKMVSMDTPKEPTKKPVVASGQPVDEDDAPLVQMEKLKPPKVKPQTAKKPITVSQWREVASTMNGDRPQTVEALNQWLSKNGYETKPVTTARRWLAMAQAPQGAKE
jgi:hypothetical protein